MKLKRASVARIVDFLLLSSWKLLLGIHFQFRSALDPGNQYEVVVF